jgi:hypothetical protein
VEVPPLPQEQRRGTNEDRDVDRGAEFHLKERSEYHGDCHDAAGDGKPKRGFFAFA